MVEVGGVPKAKQWGWTRGQWPKKSVQFLLHMLKNAESDAELQGLDIDSLAIEHSQWTQLQDAAQNLTELMSGLTHTWAPLASVRRS